MSDQTANGVRLHIERLAAVNPAADSPVVVFLHGMAVDDLSSFYFTLASPTTELGADVLLYDQRGHGLSERPATGYRVRDGVADLFALLDELKITTPVVLVGNSYGGLVAAHAALREPGRIAGLVLIDAGFVGTSADEWLAGIINSLTALALVYEYDKTHEHAAAVGWRKIARKSRGMNLLLNETSLIEDLAVTEPVGVEQLSALSCPVLAIFGEHSAILDAAYEMAAHIADCTVEILDGLNHTVVHDGPTSVNEVLAAWLTSRGLVPGRTA